MPLKQTVFNYLKNISGWRTNRKLVVISVDDYGNVRLDSKKARENMDKAGLKVHSRFDAYDTLETREDLEALYEVLTSVKDKNGNHAVFTPFALPCNINFEALEQNGYEEYKYELLPETFHKLEVFQSKAYQGAWSIWLEGIQKRIMVPQFHGREHFNLLSFQKKLDNKDSELLTSLKNRSLTSITSSGIPNIGWTAAFSFNKSNEINAFPEILKTGTDAFESVYGFKSKTFTPPAQQFPEELEDSLQDYGIENIDKPFHFMRHNGAGKYSHEFNYLTKGNKNKLNIIVRNVVFEPTAGKVDHVGKALKQVEAAFRLGKPANISSHRVNYCGHVASENRRKGLDELKMLLQHIVKRWPDVEFIGCNRLGEIMGNSIEEKNKKS